MANRGYPDDDGSRTPDGIHDESPKSGTSYLDVAPMLHPATVADMQTNANPIQGYGTSDNPRNDQGNFGWAVDGRTGNLNVAAYPPKPEDPNSRD